MISREVGDLARIPSVEEEEKFVESGIEKAGE